jgi:predicted enzyme related to lactoylglutathione lyase
MLNLNSIMIGTSKVQEMAEFYKKVFDRPADMVDGDWHGWQVGKGFLTIGAHSEIHGKAQEPQRIIMNYETTEVKEEFERIKTLGATVIKEPYDMGNHWFDHCGDEFGGNYCYRR